MGQGDQTDARVGLGIVGENRARIVCRGVIDGDEFPLLECLTTYRLDTLAEIRDRIIDGHKDANLAAHGGNGARNDY